MSVMISNILDRISFVSLFLVITLLPVFFLPFSKIPIETSKGLLVVVGLVVSFLFWAIARFFDGKISLPKSLPLLAAFVIVLSFLLSASFAPSIRTSFFGTMFDMGTFWFMLACFFLMLISAVVIRDTKRALLLFLGVILFSVVVLVFQIFRLAIPEILSFGILGLKTDNILGSWNALGIFVGLMGVVSLFALEFFQSSQRIKWVLRVFILIFMAFAAAVNFSLVWALLGVFALVIFVFKILSYSFERQREGSKPHFPLWPLVVVILSLLFFMSGPLVKNLLPDRLGVVNVEVRPSLGTTMLIVKETLKKDPILGAGPNRFGEMWALYKPVSINFSQFWDMYFDFGSGLLPTFAVTTGILGILAWLAFFYLFFATGMKSVFATMKDGTNPETALFFLASLYLFIASFFYPVGAVLFLLAFAFAGVFVGLHASANPNRIVSVLFLDDPRKSFFYIIFLVLLMIVAVITSFKFIERFVSVSYFKKTLLVETVSVAETSIAKAVELNPNDLYLRTYAQVYLVKLNSQVSENRSAGEGTDADLQATFDQAMNGARLAISYNHTNYVNFRALGIVYDSVAALGVPGAYDKAIEAYQSASTLNPFNPGLKLSIARAYFASGKTKEAKDYAEQALVLKPDYLEVLIALSQIWKSEGDMAQARLYGQRALLLSPPNKDLTEYVSSLK